MTMKYILFLLISGLSFCLDMPDANAQSCADNKPGLCVNVLINYYVYAPVNLGLSGKRCTGSDRVEARIEPHQYGNFEEIVYWKKTCHGSYVILKITASYWNNMFKVDKVETIMNGHPGGSFGYFPKNHNASKHTTKIDPPGRGYAKIDLRYSYIEKTQSPTGPAGCSVGGEWYQHGDYRTMWPNNQSKRTCKQCDNGTWLYRWDGWCGGGGGGGGGCRKIQKRSICNQTTGCLWNNEKKRCKRER